MSKVLDYAKVALEKLHKGVVALEALEASLAKAIEKLEKEL